MSDESSPSPIPQPKPSLPPPNLPQPPVRPPQPAAEAYTPPSPPPLPIPDHQGPGIEPGAEHSPKETADKALAFASEKWAEGQTEWKKLDHLSQAYLGGLAATVFFGIFFSMASVTVTLAGVVTQKSGSVSAFSSGHGPRFAILAALAGLGLWVWNFKSAEKRPWVPQALAGCAALCALLLLWVLFTYGNLDTGPKLGKLMQADVDLALLGYWVPLLGAGLAVWASVKQLKSKSKSKSSGGISEDAGL